jgi:uncharacterized membrane protein
MSNKLTLLITFFLVVVVIVAGVLLWNRMPQPMASHWNAQDQVDGYTSKFWGLFLVPLMMMGINLLFFAIPAIDPLKKNISQFRGLYNIFMVLFNVLMTYIHALTLAWNLGFTGFRFSTAMIPAIGLLFILVGLGLRKAKRNYFIGIRTPWTLASDKVWEGTHRLGGILFAVSGVVTLLGIVFPRQAFLLLIVPILTAAVIAVVYSYLLFRRLENL